MDNVLGNIQARRALEHQLAPSTAFAVWELIAGPLVEIPQRVRKQLISLPFQGDWAARRGHYRVRYQIDDEKHAITVIDIADRSAELHKLWNAQKKADPDLAWWAENSKCAYQEAFRNLDRALRDYIRSRKGERKGRRVGFPRFKKRGKCRDSFRLYG